jgi:hypothetical protein
MSVDNKPHSGEPIAVEDVNFDGKKILRFTDAWYNYFNSVDQNINVTITQNILNQTMADSAGYTPDVAIEIDELKATVSSLFSTVRELMDIFSQVSAEVTPRHETESLISQEYARPGHTHSLCDIENYTDEILSYTVATLPEVPSSKIKLIFVSNESGGAVIAFSDFTNWRRVTDRAIVS